MPYKTKSSIAKEDISIEDVIGAPKKSSEAKGAGSAVSSEQNVKADKPVIKTAEAKTAEVQKTVVEPYSFVPGMVASADVSKTSVPGSYMQNHVDRYSSTPTQKVSGFLDIMSEGHGFLRPKFVPGEGDIYISQSQIRKFQLREGDEVGGQARLPKENERYLGLLKVETVNGDNADKSPVRPRFEDLVPIYPKSQLILETGKTPLSTRIIDLFSPIGFGQRGLIVSPPKAGKTTILKEIAHGISVNFPKAHLMAVLIGERPEDREHHH